tara:strand:+ start:267 stop:608 length:342 start_codon:yes stop_codon:yes gene_type:complete
MSKSKLDFSDGASMVQEKPTKKSSKKKKRQSKKPPVLTVEEAVSTFVGEVDNLHKISIENVDNSKYRVNVWTVVEQPDRICDAYNIIQSYFMKFEDGKLTDLTIKPKEDTNPW